MTKNNLKQYFEVKPFIAWLGGKNKIINQLDNFLPADFNNLNNITYVEPFLGGGSFLFHILLNYSNIDKVIVNDLNYDLIETYKVIKNNSNELISYLDKLENKYLNINNIVDKRDFYHEKRNRYNNSNLNSIEKSSLFIFLNKTGFSGRFRTNKEGQFNPSFAARDNLRSIYNKENIINCSNLLKIKNVIFFSDDFSKVLEYVDSKNVFLYLDPPYKPDKNDRIGQGSKIYSFEAFDDTSQIRLKEFCDILTDNKFKFLESNSDPLIENSNESYFEKLYDKYIIEKIISPQTFHKFIDKSKDIEKTEILIRNYSKIKKDNFKITTLF